GGRADNRAEAEVVCADGRVRTASRERHPDLFWALRGGGAHFGVVTRFAFRLHPVGPQVAGGLIAWPFERAAEVMATYRALTGTAPRALAAWLVLLNPPPAPFLAPEWPAALRLRHLPQRRPHRRRAGPGPGPGPWRPGVRPA